MLELLTPHLRVLRSAAGATILASSTELPAPARAVGDWLVRWARERPTYPFLAERDASGAWARLTYAQALRAVEGLGSALLAAGVTPERPVMILSDNSVDAALVQLGALHAGLPVAPVSSAYSLLSAGFGRLRAVAEQLRPGVVFADDPERYAPALAALAPHLDHALLLGSRATAGAQSVADLARTPPSPALARAFAALSPETIAKILFTSGSTGAPKGIVNLHRMLTANQESIAAIWPFLRERPPTFVDWLPWSHTFGGNHNFFLALRQGGSLYLDRGRPAPGLIETTLRNLADVGPDLWFNVPRGFDQAVAWLERDDALAMAVFRNLHMIFYAAAALSPQTRARLEAVAARVGRPDVFFTSSWGATETSPLATSAHFATRTTGVLGVPVPGVQLKLAAVQDRLELRVRGPNVTPGTWRPGGEIEPLSLDEDGFWPTGDAGELVDEARPEAGVVFRGRLSENFKLSSGTWVSVAQVRLGLVDACAPWLLDAVIAGHDRESLGALLFLSPAARERPRDEVRAALQQGLARYDAEHPSSSERVESALIVDEPLSLDEGETTDKGYTNQRRVLERRRAAVERLFAEEASDDVLRAAGP